jgi:hypothetical protein
VDVIVAISKKRAWYYLLLPLPVDFEAGGDRGIRTPDLRDANAALSRLSYIPDFTTKL